MIMATLFATGQLALVSTHPRDLDFDFHFMANKKSESGRRLRAMCCTTPMCHLTKRGRLSREFVHHASPNHGGK